MRSGIEPGPELGIALASLLELVVTDPVLNEPVYLLARAKEMLGDKGG